MQSIIGRFIGFNSLLGPSLVKVVYYFGAATIVVTAGFALMMALFALFGGNIGTGLMQLLAVPAVAAVGLVYWRFLCELFMIAFLAYERLVEIRNSMQIATGEASAPEPNHPAF